MDGLLNCWECRQITETAFAAEFWHYVDEQNINASMRRVSPRIRSMLHDLVSKFGLEPLVSIQCDPPPTAAIELVRKWFDANSDWLE